MAKKRIDSEAERSLAAEQILNHPRKSLSDIIPGGRSKNTITFIEEDEKSEPTGKRSKIFKDALLTRDASDNVSRERSLKSKLVAPKFFLSLAGILACAVAFYVAWFILPRAELQIILAETPREYQGDINAAVTGGDVSAQIFNQNKNLQLSFVATGKKYSESKATGIIRIYNAYSSEKQPLVASTRFVSPDGKIFRLTKSTVVPGAKIADGKITPSSIEVSVAADKTGGDYNIGPVAKWVIPGFKGTPKYDGFYGVSEAAMAEGADGEHAYPNDDDLKKAKAATEATVKDALSTSFAFQVPKELSIVEGGSSLKIVKSSVVGGVNADGKFTYFVEARDSRIAVNGNDIKKYFTAKALGELGGEVKVKNTEAKFSFKKSLLKPDNSLYGAILAVNFKGNFVKDVDFDDLKTKILGKSEEELKALILSVAGIQSAKVSLWPFWVKSVPTSADKVTLSVD